MTAEPVPSTRTVVLKRLERPWPDGYFHKLLGLEVKMPALVENGRVLVGFLVGVEESAEAFTLEFSDLEPE